MKYLIYIILMQSTLLCTSCILHSSSKLIKRMECAEINEITLRYQYKSKLKLHNIPTSSNSDGTWQSPYYQIELTSDDIEYFSNKLCLLIDSLKSANFYRNMDTKRDYDTLYSAMKNKNITIARYQLVFSREKDLARFNISNAFLKFYYNPPFKAPYITHSDPLWTYSSGCYFSNRVEKVLSIFANEVILYKNEQIKRDTTILDSLKIMYPLINH